MYGAGVAVCLTSMACYFGQVSWWWLIPGVFVGVVGEVSIRCGCGDGFLDVLSSLGDVLPDVSGGGGYDGGGCGDGG
jgi:hypothetical protein